NTYGGWGLFGQEFKELQYLFSGYYSTWGGQATSGGFDGDRKYSGGLDVKIFPSSPFTLSLSGNITQTDAELPYQSSIRELHQTFEQNAALGWKISDQVQVLAKISNQPTT